MSAVSSMGLQRANSDGVPSAAVSDRFLRHSGEPERPGAEFEHLARRLERATHASPNTLQASTGGVRRPGAARVSRGEPGAETNVTYDVRFQQRDGGRSGIHVFAALVDERWSQRSRGRVAFGWSQFRKGVAKSAPLGNRMGMLSETPLGLASSSIVAARRRGCALHVEMGDSAVLNAA